LKPNTVLTAWLYQVTRNAAIDVVRREARRRAREQIAFQMNEINHTSADWTDIEPLLDEAMQSLEHSDRTAVLLRYFENKSLARSRRGAGLERRRGSENGSAAPSSPCENFSRNAK